VTGTRQEDRVRRWPKLVYLAVGLGLLALILTRADVRQAWDITLQIGWGFAVVLALFFVEFLIMTVIWHLTFESIPLDLAWFYRLWRIKMVGDAFNIATPSAQMAGEVIKAVILKRRHGISYVEGVATLVLARTCFVIALVVFLAAGFALVLETPVVSREYKLSAGLGLAIFSLAIAIFFVMQRFKLFSRSGRLFSRSGGGRFLDMIHVTEDRLIAFYTGHRVRFAVALVLAFTHWMLGVVTVYYTFLFLGHPITFTEAWIVEAFTQLVRAATFFIPGNLGTQDGAFVVITTALTGNPALGLAAALVRRGREIVWILWGLALGWRYADLIGRTGEEAVSPAPAGGEPTGAQEQ